MEDKDILRQIHTADPVGKAESPVSILVQLYSCPEIYLYWHDFLPVQTGSAVYIWHHFLVFHFVPYSI